MAIFDVLGEILDDDSSKRNPFPWELTRKEFEDRWYDRKPFSLPVRWLRDPGFLNSDPKRGITIRQRDASSRSQEYIDSLKDDVAKRGIQSPPSINMYSDNTFGLSDGTHRVLVAHELSQTYIPVTFTPNFLDFGGYKVLAKKAFDEGIPLPQQVLDQFGW